MLAGRLPVLILSFWIFIDVSFYEEEKKKGYIFWIVEHKHPAT